MIVTVTIIIFTLLLLLLKGIQLIRKKMDLSKIKELESSSDGSTKKPNSKSVEKENVSGSSSSVVPNYPTLEKTVLNRKPLLRYEDFIFYHSSIV